MQTILVYPKPNIDRKKGLPGKSPKEFDLFESKNIIVESKPSRKKK